MIETTKLYTVKPTAQTCTIFPRRLFRLATYHAHSQLFVLLLSQAKGFFFLFFLYNQVA
jgi:hypothetical protein